MAKIKLIKIGSGSFSKAYTTPQLDTCYIKSICPAKEGMADYLDSELSYLLPKIEHCHDIELTVQEQEKGVQVYKMPLYRKVKAPSKELKHDDFEIYQALRKAFKELEPRRYSFNDVVQEFSKLDEPLQTVMFEYLSAINSYIRQDNIRFEISPRNIALDSSGNLVLLDLFFCAETLRSSWYK